jgi:hypothetical protein
MMCEERAHICSLHCGLTYGICLMRAKDRMYTRAIKVCLPHGTVISFVSTDRRTRVASRPGL